MEELVQKKLFAQQTKIEEVNGVSVYTALPYAVLVQLTENFFNMMVAYMHPIVEKNLA